VTIDQLLQIALYIVILMAAWFVLRLIVRMTMRLFAFGCGAIVIFGLILVFMQWMSG
jgi:hypothetical protein